MKILALECSAVPCSVAVLEDDKIIASAFSDINLTHSQTLLPMAESVLSSARLTLSDIEGFAVSAGPGSFTGIRIGISAIKGMAAAKQSPCVGVSTLRAMAENYSDTDCIVCAVMDARCNQVYNGLFDISGGIVTRICEDRALLCEELAEDIKTKFDTTVRPIIVVGDGADVFYPYVAELGFAKKANPQRKYQNAVGVGFAAIEAFKKNETLSPAELLPVYLRLPQAERELKNKRSTEK